MASTTRRLAAILAADVAGYSRLMGADEQGTLTRLKAIRSELIDPQIAAHHGRIVKTTGDGLLVEFASTVDALRCASAVQAQMMIAIRIGCSDWSNSNNGSSGCNAGGLCGNTAISCNDAAKATPVPQTCGLTRRPNAFAMSAIFLHSEMPPAAQVSGCRISTARSTRSGRNPQRVNSASPPAIGIERAALTSCQRARSQRRAGPATSR
jgi:hypothetical protein